MWDIPACPTCPHRDSGVRWDHGRTVWDIPACPNRTLTWMGISSLHEGRLGYPQVPLDSPWQWWTCITGCTASWLRFELGRREEINDNSIGAFACSSSHTDFQLKCSRAGFDFKRSIESCESEHTATISCCRILLAIFSTIWGLSFSFPTTALAIDCRLPRPTYRPSFFKDWERW